MPSKNTYQAATASQAFWQSSESNLRFREKKSDITSRIAGCPDASESVFSKHWSRSQVKAGLLVSTSSRANVVL